jgi:hypothetical protein
MKQETCRKKGKQEVSSAFLKKTRKKLSLFWSVLISAPETRTHKVFCFFFSKKKRLLLDSLLNNRLMRRARR